MPGCVDQSSGSCRKMLRMARERPRLFHHLLRGDRMGKSMLGGRSEPRPEHAVIVEFLYGTTDLGPLFALEEELESAIAGADVGEYDGNEIAVDGSDGCLWMYGPDADALFGVVKPILFRTPFMQGAIARLRYGPPGGDAREIAVPIGGTG